MEMNTSDRHWRINPSVHNTHLKLKDPGLCLPPSVSQYMGPFSRDIQYNLSWNFASIRPIDEWPNLVGIRTFSVSRFQQFVSGTYSGLIYHLFRNNLIPDIIEVFPELIGADQHKLVRRWGSLVRGVSTAVHLTRSGQQYTTFVYNNNHTATLPCTSKKRNMNLQHWFTRTS